MSSASDTTGFVVLSSWVSKRAGALKPPPSHPRWSPGAASTCLRPTPSCRLEHAAFSSHPGAVIVQIAVIHRGSSALVLGHINTNVTEQGLGMHRPPGGGGGGRTHHCLCGLGLRVRSLLSLRTQPSDGGACTSRLS